MKRGIFAITLLFFGLLAIAKSTELVFREVKDKEGHVFEIYSSNPSGRLPGIPGNVEGDRFISIPGLPPYKVLTGQISLNEFSKYQFLQKLSLSGIRSIDANGIQELPSLQYLDLSYATVSDLDQVNSDSVQTLKLNAAGTGSKGQLLRLKGGWKNLNDLELNDIGNRFDFSCLSDLGIRRLSMKNYSGKNLNFLNIDAIRELDVDGTVQADLDISSLGASSLEMLILGQYRKITDLSPLNRLAKLKILDVSLRGDERFRLMDLPPSVKELSLWNGKRVYSAQEAASVARLPLQRLSLMQVQFQDITPLMKIPVTALRLNQVLTPDKFLYLLKENSNLRYLSLGIFFDHNGNVRQNIDWDSLKDLSVTELDLSKSNMTECSWISEMKKLRILLLPSTITSLKDLKDMRLEYLLAPGIKDLKEECEKYNIRIQS